MIGRRAFIAGSATALAAPFILTKSYADTPRMRRDVQSLAANDPWFAKYGQAVQAMHELQKSKPNDQRNWRNQALIHLNHCKHGSPEFPHWHRHYIANFEAICAQLIGDPSFSLAYWNWSANMGRMPDPFYDLPNLNVTSLNDPSNAQSNNWGSVTTVGTRGLSKGQGLQDDPLTGGDFSKDKIDTILALPDYASFRSRLERSPHNNGHVISGGDNGHMSDGMSPLDPIFWLHHCNVDRLWAQWQAAGNTTPGFNGDYSGNFVDAAGHPVTTATSANALKIASFNYTYDVLSPSIVEAQSKLLKLEPFNAQTAVNAASVSTATKILGADTAQKIAAMRVETRFSVQAKELLPNMFRSRAFWASEVPGVQRVAVEPGRILARLSNVMGPKERAPMIVNVFVNCPYLSPETGYKDKHYAGSFSFFGPSGHDHDDVYIDVTAPLRALAGDGRIATEQVNVQLMPLPVGERAAKASFSVGSVQLLAV
jgi:tyrosinase